MQTYFTSSNQALNSCIVKFGKQRYRALVDSGAEVSLMHRRVYDALHQKPKLGTDNLQLQAVTGASLALDGCIDVQLRIGDTEIQQKFYVVANMNRNLILGRDWLVQHGVRLYFDLGCLRIGRSYVPLERDIHIASIARLKSSRTFKPQTAQVCLVKIKNHPELRNGMLFQISGVDRGYVYSEPGLSVANSIGTLRRNRVLSVLVVNSTNKTIRLKRHCVIGKIEPISSQSNIVDVNTVCADTSKQKPKSNINFQELVVPGKHRNLITKIIKENSDLFASKDSELSQTDTITMKIDTGDHKPIKLPPYRTSLNNRVVVDKAVDEMLEANIIRRSKSPWSFPVVIVDKKDGTKRFCVDFRKLNKITKLNSHPLPLIDDILALLGDAKYFTSLDLKSGYWQIMMDEKDKEKTAFTCHRGLYEFNVLAFGLVNAPGIFQSLMQIVLDNCGHFATAYLDDILIFSPTLESHIEHINIVFQRLRQHKLKMKLKKCQFLQTETNYLGFIVNEAGIKPDPAKVAAIKTILVPKTVREVRSFIGMASYYRRFIPNFSKIAEPIIALTKKYARFSWTNECQVAFEFLKESLTVVPLLCFPDRNKRYTLYTDASNSCIGACLTQPCNEIGDEEIIPGVKHEKPLYYLSHKLSASQCKWSTIEKEAYAIYFALQKLDFYLHDAQFTIKTDHKPLKYLLEAPMQNKKIQMWALSISGYNCNIEYIAGTENSCADLLSRIPDNGDMQPAIENFEPDAHPNLFEIAVLNSNQFDVRQFASCDLPADDCLELPRGLLKGYNMAEEQNKDSEIVEFKTILRQGSPSKAVQKRYIVLNDILYYISDADDNPTLRLCVPMHLRGAIVKQYHDDNGHMGVQKSFEAIRRKYFWPLLYKELYEYVGKCVVCQSRSLQRTRPPLQETDIPPYPFAKLSLDLSGPYPTSLSGNKYIIAFVDWYSGWPEAFPVKNKTGETVSYLLTEEIFPRFGCPLAIVSDNGSENVNRVMKETCSQLNIHHILTSVYHPQSNSKVERFHRTLHDILAKKVSEDPSTWDLHLNQTLAAIRFNISETTKFSPYYLLYNRDVVLPVDNIMQPRRKYYGDDVHQINLEAQHKAFLQVRSRLKRSKEKQAKYYDKKVSKTTEFNVGDAVYHKNNQRKGKLDLKWEPYYRIIEKKTPVTYVIKNQLDGNTLKVHADSLRMANIDTWEIDTQIKGARPLRKSRYVAVSESESESSTADQGLPVDKLAHKLRREREDSDSEDDIPLMELAQRLKNRKNPTPCSSSNSSSESEPSMPPVSSSGQLTDNIDGSDNSDVMDIDSIQKRQKLKSRKTKRKQFTMCNPVPGEKVRGLIKLIGSML